MDAYEYREAAMRGNPTEEINFLLGLLDEARDALDAKTQRVEKAEAELTTAREKDSQLNRRCQQAEGRAHRFEHNCKALEAALRKAESERDAAKERNLEFIYLRARLSRIEALMEKTIEAREMFFRYGQPWKDECNRRIDALRAALGEDAKAKPEVFSNEDYISVLSDEAKGIARRLSAQGVPVEKWPKLISAALAEGKPEKRS